MTYALIGTTKPNEVETQAWLADVLARIADIPQPRLHELLTGRLWLNDGSCIRLRAERADHVWSCDFVHHPMYDGRAFRMLNVLDEFARESMAIRVRRKLSPIDVFDVLTDLFNLRGIPVWIHSDNGPESSRRPCGGGSLRWGPAPPSSS